MKVHCRLDGRPSGVVYELLLGSTPLVAKFLPDERFGCCARALIALDRVGVGTTIRPAMVDRPDAAAAPAILMPLYGPTLDVWCVQPWAELGLAQQLKEMIVRCVRAGVVYRAFCAAHIAHDGAGGFVLIGLDAATVESDARRGLGPAFGVHCPFGGDPSVRARLPPAVLGSRAVLDLTMGYAAAACMLSLRNKAPSRSDVAGRVEWVQRMDRYGLLGAGVAARGVKTILANLG